MNDALLKATHQGEINIVGIKMPCAVLEDGTRVLRERSVAKSLGRKGSGAHWQKKRSSEKGALLPEYVSPKNLDRFIDDETRKMLLNPIVYETKTGIIAQGIPAVLLPKICDIWLNAKEKDALYGSQIKTAKRAEILMRGLAHVGIIALVDEATGYQEVRDRIALQKILEKYITKELLPWTKKFPNEFYKEMFRLRNWQYSPVSVNRPSLVGKLTNDLVYKRLAPGVLAELKRITPRDEKGRTKHRYHQRLTEDIGHPKLAEHLSSVLALMRAAASWPGFYRLIQRALPRYGDTLTIKFDDEDINK
jgi:hypothetical protein